MTETKRIPAETELDRYSKGIKCTCGGFADEVDVTPEEEKEFGCGRTGCCSRAFVCALCDTRWVGKAEAPEMRD